MNKETLRREKLQDEHKEDEYREAHERSFLVKFKGGVYIDALNKEEAEERFKDKDDIVEYVDLIEVTE